MKTGKDLSHTHLADKKIPKKIAAESNSNSVIQQLCQKDVVCLSKDATIFEAAKLMSEKQVGDIVIVEKNDAGTVPIGIITDRDIVLKTTAKRIAPENIKVGDVMTKNVATAADTDELSDIIDLMTKQGISRLPIVDETKNLVGILSSKKLYQYLSRSLCELSNISQAQKQKEERSH